ncbi:hypothetical protein BH24ACT26_BH24ACT26_02990 [soil metagenome]
MARARWVAAAALLALGVVACGDSGPSREDFAAEANPICERHTETIAEAAGEVMAGGQLPDPKEFGRLAQETIIPELTQQFQELEEVEVPEDLSEEYEVFLERGDQVVEDIQADPSLVTDPSNFQEINQNVDELGLSRTCYVGPS